jgi:hypothetical protein
VAQHGGAEHAGRLGVVGQPGHRQVDPLHRDVAQRDVPALRQGVRVARAARA